MMNRRRVIAGAGVMATFAATGYALWPSLDAYEQEVTRQRRALAARPEIGDLIRMATLAANGHNAQPWRFGIRDNQVSILPDFSRRTAVVDPDDHHLFVSLGCAAENLMIAAAARGFAPQFHPRSDPTTGLEISLTQGAGDHADLASTIPHRQSTRSVYDGRPISNQDIAALDHAAREEGVSLHIFTDPSHMDRLLEMVIAGNSQQMDTPAFVRELRDWIRFSPRDALAQMDGLFGPVSGNPVAPAWVGEALFGMLFTKVTENDKYSAQIRSSAGLAVFVADQSGPEHWMRVGRSFERFALKATSLNIRTAHLNQPIEVVSLRRELASWLGVPDKRPNLLIRFGRAPKLPMSLRRPVDRLML